MIYCRSRELRAKTLESYEHTLRLFERWCNDELDITQVDQVTESVIRRYITNLQERGKYTFYANEKSKEFNYFLISHNHTSIHLSDLIKISFEFLDNIFVANYLCFLAKAANPRKELIADFNVCCYDKVFFSILIIEGVFSFAETLNGSI